MSLETEVRSIVVDVVHKIRAESSVEEAVKLMLEKDVGCLIVSKIGPIGILTERDVLRKVTGRGLDPAKTRVEDVMSSPLISVSPSTTIGDAAKKMMESRIRRLVVMDEEGTFMGLVTMTDVIRWMARQKELSDSLQNYLRHDIP